MSFSLQFTCPPSEVAAELAKVEAPEPVKTFINEAAAVLEDKKKVQVHAYGHMYTGKAPNYETCSATINVSPA